MNNPTTRQAIEARTGVRQVEDRAINLDHWDQYLQTSKSPFFLCLEWEHPELKEGFVSIIQGIREDMDEDAWRTTAEFIADVADNIEFVCQSDCGLSDNGKNLLRMAVKLHFGMCLGLKKSDEWMWKNIMEDED